MIHGEPRTYKRGCRCRPCTDAVNEYNRNKDRRKKQQARIPFDPILSVMSMEQKRQHWALIESSTGKTIPIYQADRLCIKFGYHPWTVYGDMWFQDLWEKDEQAKAKGNKG